MFPLKYGARDVFILLCVLPAVDYISIQMDTHAKKCFLFSVSYGHMRKQYSFLCLLLQKARLARIRMAKNASGAAFLNSKKRAEEIMIARESGLELDEYKEDIFEMQHHHLLSCLEKTTVS